MTEEQSPYQKLVLVQKAVTVLAETLTTTEEVTEVLEDVIINQFFK